MSNIKKAIITDAGFASRFLPVTKTLPKAMLPIEGKPAMQFCVEECAAAGIEEIVIVATPGTMSRKIYEDYFHGPAENVRNLLEKQGKSERFEAVTEVLNLPKITVIEQDPSLPYGNASPIVSAKDFVADEEAFIVLYSDDLVFGAGDVKTLIETYENASLPDSDAPDAAASNKRPNGRTSSIKGVIAAQEMPREVWHRYGMIALKENGALSHIVEKPKTPDLSPSNLTSYGRYLLTPEIFDYLDPKRLGLDDELWTVDAITELAKHGDVLVARSRGHWVTTGDPKNYFLAQLEYVLRHTDYAPEIRKALG